MKTTTTKRASRAAAAIAVAAAAAVLLAGSAGRAADAQVVSVRNEFVPKVVVMEAGSTLRYTNLDPSVHSVTADIVDPTTKAPLFDSGLVAIAETGIVEGAEDLAPSAAGYPFRCKMHTQMTGTLIVL